MNGIPVRIERNGQPETVYLSTRRSGDAGESMKKHKRAYHKANLAIAKASQRIVMLMAKAEKLDPERDDYVEALERVSVEKFDEDVMISGYVKG